MQAWKSKCVRYYTKSGQARYKVEIGHKGLSRYKEVAGDSQYVVEQKAFHTMQQWDQTWAKKHAAMQKANTLHRKKQLAEELTEKAQKSLDALDSLLANSITAVGKWTRAIQAASFTQLVPAPTMPKTPVEPPPPPFGTEPQSNAPRYRPTLTLFDWLIPSRKTSKSNEAYRLYKADHEQWSTDRDRRIKAHEDLKAKLSREYRLAVEQYEQDLLIHRKSKIIFTRYISGDLTDAADYCDLILSISHYPDCFPKSYDLEYDAETKNLIVDYAMPAPDAIPTLRAVKYVQSRDKHEESHLPDSKANSLYDRVLYQAVLRTQHELFECDTMGLVQSVVFNGIVSARDSATGHNATACILSVQATREEFKQIDLAHVDPKACFRKLKGVGSAKLCGLAAVAPIMEMSKDDRRFVASRDVVKTLEQGENLAAMDWEDFEHLIRQIFEREFAATGGEVKVTQASRDGGIDAVVLDPDPIRGGKIVIQAKRYTNVVGVSAVRDLYGALMNEGANKGILVTTSKYGPDAYSFSKGKPLTLLDGANLLHLLQKHGHQYRINLAEAKSVLKEREGDVKK